MGERDYKRLTWTGCFHSWTRRVPLPVLVASIFGLVVLLYGGYLYTSMKNQPSKPQHPPMVHLDVLPPEYMDTFRQEAGVSSIPDRDALAAMSGRQRERLYYSYLDNVDFLCRRKLRMGSVGDGGWEVCDDAAYRPVAPCLVYSFGINFDYTFDDAVARAYGCDVFAFDPSMNTETHNRSQRVHFYALGIGPRDETDAKGWRLRTLASLTAMLGHGGRTLDVVKMDVEGAEWKTIPEMAASGSLRTIRQLYVEFHADLKPEDETLVDKLTAVRAIELAGFRRFFSHKNPACAKNSEHFPGAVTICYEVYFLNPALARTNTR